MSDRPPLLDPEFRRLITWLLAGLALEIAVAVGVVGGCVLIGGAR